MDRKQREALGRIGRLGCEILGIIKCKDLEGLTFQELKNHENLGQYSENQIATSLRHMKELGLVIDPGKLVRRVGHGG